jgi:hypothetical protein
LIPKSIQQMDVMSALREIDEKGVPAGRQSRKFHLVHGRRQYPPKYVLTLACKFQSGQELDPGTSNGGDETNHFLRGLGFVIGPRVNQESPCKGVARSGDQNGGRPEGGHPLWAILLGECDGECDHTGDGGVRIWVDAG